MSKPLKVWSGTEWINVSSFASSGGGGGSASGTPLNIANTLVARSASGSFQIGSVDFHTASPVISSVGRMTWNDGEGTVDIGLKGGNIVLPIGQEEVTLCYNGTGSTIPKGRVVYISGAQGQRPSISLSNNSSESTSSKTFGVTSEAISDGQEGYVTTFGTVADVDTSTFTEGSSLWLSSSSGLMTQTIPSAPQHMVFIGYCLKSHASAGRVFVNPQNGYELQELHNVKIVTASQTHILAYNSASSLWENKGLLESVLEIDGSGSGLDADLLDGEHGAYYQGAAAASATYLSKIDAALTYIPITASSEYLTETEAVALYIPISASYRTFDADKLDGYDANFFINSSSAVQEKTGQITFHDTVYINNLVITGSAITISSTNLALTDSLIQLAHEQYSTDAVDIGIVGSYGDGTTSSASHYHASFARDASQNKWKLLSNGPAPVNNTIDYSDPSVEFGAIEIGSLEVKSGNIQLSSSAIGIILKSPNNTSYLLKVADDGSLTTEAI